jgi:hypothetical protein
VTSLCDSGTDFPKWATIKAAKSQSTRSGFAINAQPSQRQRAVEMTNNKANMNDEDVPIDVKVDAVVVSHA